MLFAIILYFNEYISPFKSELCGIVNVNELFVICHMTFRSKIAENLGRLN